MRSKALLTATTIGITFALLTGIASARLSSAKRTFAPPLRAAMKNVVRPAAGTRLTNRVYLQPVKGGATLMSVVGTVKGKPMVAKTSGRAFVGGNAYYLIGKGGAVERLTSWGQLDKVKLDRSAGAKAAPATKVYLNPLTNGGAFLSTKGQKGGIRYFYLGKTGQVKPLKTWRQANKVSSWIKD